MLFSIIAIAVAVAGFMAGSLWLFSAAIGFLVLKMYPLLLALIVFIGAGLLAFKHYWRQ